jgi:PTS system mannose-specific IIA component
LTQQNSPFGIIIVAHGGLAEHYYATLEHVLGKQERVAYVSIDDADDREERRARISKLADELDAGTGVVLVTDMFGGTPSNLALRCKPDVNQNVLYGVSMPSLVKLARSRHLSLKKAMDAAVEAGHRYLNYRYNDNQQVGADET